MSDFIETKEHKYWCQNSKCAKKQTQNQLRGTKGHKYYQSNRASKWYVYWCGMRCREAWWEAHKDTCIRAIGLRTEPVKLPMERAWSKDYDCHWNNTSNDRNDQHYLENKLMGIRIPITEAQYDSLGWSNDECLALANTLQAKQSA